MEELAALMATKPQLAREQLQQAVQVPKGLHFGVAQLQAHPGLKVPGTNSRRVVRQAVCESHLPA